MRIQPMEKPRRMVGKNISIRPSQEAWLMVQAAENHVTFSEAIRAVIDFAKESDNAPANPPRKI